MYRERQLSDQSVDIRSRVSLSRAISDPIIAVKPQNILWLLSGFWLYNGIHYESTIVVHETIDIIRITYIDFLLIVSMMKPTIVVHETHCCGS